MFVQSAYGAVMLLGALWTILWSAGTQRQMGGSPDMKDHNAEED